MTPLMPSTWSVADVSEQDVATDDSAITWANNLTFAEAENLLDWLQGQGVQARDVQIQDDGLLTVCW